MLTELCEEVRAKGSEKIITKNGDWLGVAVCLVGMAIIMFSPRPA